MLAQLLVALVLVVSCRGSEDEARLYKYIESSVFSHTRPVKQSETALNLTIKFWMFNIHEFDEDDQSFQVIGMLEQSWVDEYASWNPKDFGGVAELQIPVNLVWTPTIKLVPGYYGRDGLEMLIRSDGTVIYVIMSKFKTKCPFISTANTTTCKLVFMPWAHDTSEINLIARPMAMSPTMFIENRHWKIDAHDYAKHEAQYPCCPNVKYGDVTYIFNLSYTK